MTCIEVVQSQERENLCNQSAVKWPEVVKTFAILYYVMKRTAKSGL